MSATCLDCSAPPAQDRARCEVHLARVREAMRKHLDANREEINARRREHWAMKSRAGRQEWNLARYGITHSDYVEMHTAQQGLCAICLRPETSLGNHGKVKNLSVDHDHESGRVRGLLCNNCNRAIGLLKDDALVLARAFAYLVGDTELMA